MRFFAAAAIVGVLMGAPLTAHAATDSNYTPDDPSTATLAGTTVSCECRSDERWIDYEVRVTAPGAEVVSGEAVLTLDLGARSIGVPLGSLADGVVTGRLPWPGGTGAVAPVVAATVTVPGMTPLAVPLAVPECDAPQAALAATGMAGWALPLGATLVAAGLVVRSVRRSRVP